MTVIMIAAVAYAYSTYGSSGQRRQSKAPSPKSWSSERARASRHCPPRSPTYLVRLGLGL